jgi:hypothetical protein
LFVKRVRKRETEREKKHAAVESSHKHHHQPLIKHSDLANCFISNNNHEKKRKENGGLVNALKAKRINSFQFSDDL